MLYLVDDLVAFNIKLDIPPGSPLLQELVVTVHEDGHRGMQCMLHHLQRDFHAPNLHTMVQDFIHVLLDVPTLQVRTPPPSGSTLAAPYSDHDGGQQVGHPHSC